jgi:hypothetical protein
MSALRQFELMAKAGRDRCEDDVPRPRRLRGRRRRPAVTVLIAFIEARFTDLVAVVSREVLQTPNQNDRRRDSNQERPDE